MMAVSTRKLPQKTPAIILQEKKDLSSNEVGEAQHIMNIAKERDNYYGSQAETCSQCASRISTVR